MSEIDLETRIELLITNYAAMLSHLAELERKLNEFEQEIKSWN